MIGATSLTKAILGACLLEPGVISHTDGSISKAFEMEPLPSCMLEDGFDGSATENLFSKLSDLLSKLPSLLETQLVLSRKLAGECAITGFRTTLYAFERVSKTSSYSHLQSLATELGMSLTPLSTDGWRAILTPVLGAGISQGKVPDLIWERDSVRTSDRSIRVLSLTELPQITWRGCLQPLFEFPSEFLLSIHIKVPDRAKIKKQLETKRRVSHALSVTTSLEVRNIESNSVLNSSEETLERILVSKETLFEISLGILLSGESEHTQNTAHELERIVSGVGNAGLFIEGIGTLPVLQSHLPGGRPLGIRTLPILSENLGHLLPVLHDYSRADDPSRLELRSRTGEVSHLNLFSKANLNFNAFICGASGSGKSFLMNAMLTSVLKDEPASKLCIFDVGGSYSRIIRAQGGESLTLTTGSATAMIAEFLRTAPVSASGFYRAFIETLCGSGTHITHSHRVAIDDLLREQEGMPLSIGATIERAGLHPERFYQDIAHWLKPHLTLDHVQPNADFSQVLTSHASAFDFKELDSSPVLQRATILLLSELVWRDLVQGQNPRTLIVFDEVWRFFAEARGFLEEMYRTLRKYRAGIVSITQNLADYGDDAFAKMLFTNSNTKIFLQNGAAAEYLRNTFDLPHSDIVRALSVVSKKPHYSEFFALTANLSQIFRLYPTEEFYSLANTENVVAFAPREKTV